MTQEKQRESNADFQAFETLDGKAGHSLVLLGDHAMRHLPDEYGSLGLPAAEFDRHIAYDIGIEWFLRRLHTLLKAPTIMARFSRLLIDPNRGMEDPTIIRQIYDGTIIPGNYPLSAEVRNERIDHFHQPYHQEVQRVIDETEAQSGKPPLIISMHSFTHQMKGKQRPWHIGILWDQDPRCKDTLFEALKHKPEWVIGDNQPYEGALRGDTMYTHCSADGLAHGLIEIRQDLIDTREKAEHWANQFAPMLEAIANMPDMHKRQYFGSKVGPLKKDPS